MNVLFLRGVVCCCLNLASSLIGARKFCFGVFRIGGHGGSAACCSLRCSWVLAHRCLRVPIFRSSPPWPSLIPRRQLSAVSLRPRPNNTLAPRDFASSASELTGFACVQK